MAKFKINWIEKKVSPKNGTEYWVMSLTDEEENIKDNVSTFEKTYQSGMEIEGEIIQNGNYLNWKPKVLEKPNFMKKGANMDRIVEKKAGLIAESQERKEKSIEAAQDRSAWMWAKTNASTLIANNENYRNYTADQLFNELEELATKIYNAEPLVPFN